MKSQAYQVGYSSTLLGDRFDELSEALNLTHYGVAKRVVELRGKGVPRHLTSQVTNAMKSCSGVSLSNAAELVAALGGRLLVEWQPPKAIAAIEGGREGQFDWPLGEACNNFLALLLEGPIPVGSFHEMTLSALNQRGLIEVNDDEVSLTDAGKQEAGGISPYDPPQGYNFPLTEKQWEALYALAKTGEFPEGTAVKTIRSLVERGLVNASGGIRDRARFLLEARALSEKTQELGEPLALAFVASSYVVAAIFNGPLPDRTTVGILKQKGYLQTGKKQIEPTSMARKLYRQIQL